MKIIAIILTLNEEAHLSRCINSLSLLDADILVVDSFSTDRTLEIARSYGAKILQHKFITHAKQFNWALEQLDNQFDWVLRIDADEILSDELIHEIKINLPRLGPEISGITLNRRIIFQGKLIKFGGVFPVKILRLFRLGSGVCEDRWMDEHIKVSGKIASFKAEIFDSNLNNMTWWIEKHNKYASYEALEMLNLDYKFMRHNSIECLGIMGQARIKRWIKEHLYVLLPGGIRSFCYFLYRYIFRLGFLDGREGANFHFFQAFWYRYLVDVKISEVEDYMRRENVDILTAIKKILGVQLN